MSGFNSFTTYKLMFSWLNIGTYLWIVTRYLISFSIAFTFEFKKSVIKVFLSMRTATDKKNKLNKTHWFRAIRDSKHWHKRKLRKHTDTAHKRSL